MKDLVEHDHNPHLFSSADEAFRSLPAQPIVGKLLLEAGYDPGGLPLDVTQSIIDKTLGRFTNYFRENFVEADDIWILENISRFTDEDIHTQARTAGSLLLSLHPELEVTINNCKGKSPYDDNRYTQLIEGVIEANSRFGVFRHDKNLPPEVIEDVYEQKSKFGEDWLLSDAVRYPQVREAARAVLRNRLNFPGSEDLPNEELCGLASLSVVDINTLFNTALSTIRNEKVLYSFQDRVCTLQDQVLTVFQESFDQDYETLGITDEHIIEIFRSFIIINLEDAVEDELTATDQYPAIQVLDNATSSTPAGKLIRKPDYPPLLAEAERFLDLSKNGKTQSTEFKMMCVKGLDRYIAENNLGVDKIRDANRTSVLRIGLLLYEDALEQGFEELKKKNVDPNDVADGNWLWFCYFSFHSSFYSAFEMVRSLERFANTQ